MLFKNQQLITIKEAKEKFKTDPDYFYAGFENTDQVIIHQGDLALDNLELDFDNEELHSGLIVNGNLTVKNTIVNYDMDSGPLLLVIGNLKTASLIGGGSSICIKGDLNVENTLFGHYNHGFIAVKGNTTTKILISETHDFQLKGTIKADTIISINADLENPDFTREDINKIFVKDVLEIEDNEDDNFIDSAALIDYIISDKKYLIIKDNKE